MCNSSIEKSWALQKNLFKIAEANISSDTPASWMDNTKLKIHLGKIQNAQEKKQFNRHEYVKIVSYEEESVSEKDSNKKFYDDIYEKMKQLNKKYIIKNKVETLCSDNTKNVEFFINNLVSNENNKIKNFVLTNEKTEVKKEKRKVVQKDPNFNFMCHHWMFRLIFPE